MRPPTLRTSLRALRTLPRKAPTHRAHLSTSPPILSQNTWRPGPAPPRLPREEQEIYEKLQKQSTGAFSTPRQPEPTPSSTSATASDTAASDSSSRPQSTQAMLEQLRERSRLAAKGDGEELHPNVRRGAPPEFEGEKNPKTGEVGGPKNEPLRWGVSGDWSYNGRVTDF